MQSLDGAYQRAKRARIHLANLKKRIRAFRQVVSDSVVFDEKPTPFRTQDGRQIGHRFGRLTLPSPLQIITLLVGETIYNLRSALDYLIYELAQLDSKKVIEGTQFPIDSSKKRFESRRENFLKGISDEHIAIIQGLQPCCGCQWTKMLQSISNPDKHRKLTTIQHSVGVILPPGSAETIIAEKPMKMQADVTVYVAFSDGLPVIETLEQLHSEIAKVLDLFKPEFE